MDNGRSPLCSAARGFTHRENRGPHKQPTMHPTLVTDGSYKSHTGTGLGAATGPQRPKRNRKLKLQGGDRLGLRSGLAASFRTPDALVDAAAASTTQASQACTRLWPMPALASLIYKLTPVTVTKACRSTDKPTATVSQAWSPSHHARVQGDAQTP